jgi:hypothetical protein
MCSDYPCTLHQEHWTSGIQSTYDNLTKPVEWWVAVKLKGLGRLLFNLLTVSDKRSC